MAPKSQSTWKFFKGCKDLLPDLSLVRLIWIWLELLTVINKETKAYIFNHIYFKVIFQNILQHRFQLPHPLVSMLLRIVHHTVFQCVLNIEAGLKITVDNSVGSVVSIVDRSYLIFKLLNMISSSREILCFIIRFTSFRRYSRLLLVLSCDSQDNTRRRRQYCLKLVNLIIIKLQITCNRSIHIWIYSKFLWFLFK